MVDLETMGTGTNSAILSIGAVSFNKKTILHKFYKKIDLQSCLDKGLTIDASTVKWWMQQSKSARGEFIERGEPLKCVLRDFQTWIGSEDLQMWGNGCDFDNVILRNAFSKFKVKYPWPYYSNRCFRTLRACFPQLDMSAMETTHHNALDDAIWQSTYLIKLVKKNNLKGVL